MTPTLLVHYQELTLKGRNRPWFVDHLVRNLREVTAGLGVAEVRPVMGRIEVRLQPGPRLAAALDRVRQTTGVASVAIASRVAPDLDAMTTAAIALVTGHRADSFRVSVARSDKRFPMASPDVERHVGGAVQDATGWRVDLSQPGFVVQVEIVPHAAYVSVERHRGLAGLPVGVSGRVASLLSGGIDSPVAAFRLMRRGCRVVFVHFHSYPVTSNASREKARELVRLLTRFQLRSQLVLVPFGDLQRALVLSTPPAQRVVLYRRFMLRIAERVARRSHARALVTGEVVGQVSSQTLENLATIDAAADLPVLRPLIGMDKEDITAEARRLGTFDVSIQPDEDCCQMFVPRRPAINVGRRQVERIESGLDVEALVRGALDGIEREAFGLADIP